MASEDSNCFTQFVSETLETDSLGSEAKSVEIGLRQSEAELGSGKKMKMRAEIDTSTPFESVKEAASRFGGISFWKPNSHKSSESSESAGKVEKNDKDSQDEKATTGKANTPAVASEDEATTTTGLDAASSSSSTTIHVPSWPLGCPSGVDSFYEYLLKAHILCGKDEFWRMKQSAYLGVRKYFRHGQWYHETDMRTGQATYWQLTSLQALGPGLQVLVGDIAATNSSHREFFSVWERFGVLPESSPK